MPFPPILNRQQVESLRAEGRAILEVPHRAVTVIVEVHGGSPIMHATEAKWPAGPPGVTLIGYCPGPRNGVYIAEMPAGCRERGKAIAGLIPELDNLRRVRRRDHG